MIPNMKIVAFLQNQWFRDPDSALRTFEAHAAQQYRAGQLRFLQYVTKDTKAYWEAQQGRGAILL
jgi:hypothetical protein